MVSFEGPVDERADFDELAGLTGHVTFDLAGLTRFNSEGVRRWIQFLRSLKSVLHLEFVRCSPALVDQLNMIRGTEGEAEIRSFYAPYICQVTGEVKLVLLKAKDVEDPLTPPTLTCEHGEMELDDNPRRYLGFLLAIRGQDASGD